VPQKINERLLVAPLTDLKLRAAYQKALEENLRFSGYVTWKVRAQEWVQKNLQGVSPRAISEMMHAYVASGGIIDQVRERRPEWLDFEFHYDLRITIDNRELYIETILLAEDPEPEIRVVNIHDV
jgi:hypothetical protein